MRAGSVRARVRRVQGAGSGPWRRPVVKRIRWQLEHGRPAPTAQATEVIIERKKRHGVTHPCPLSNLSGVHVSPSTATEHCLKLTVTVPSLPETSTVRGADGANRPYIGSFAEWLLPRTAHNPTLGEHQRRIRPTLPEQVSAGFSELMKDPDPLMRQLVRVFIGGILSRLEYLSILYIENSDSMRCRWVFAGLHSGALGYILVAGPELRSGLRAWLFWRSSSNRTR